MTSTCGKSAIHRDHFFNDSSSMVEHPFRLEKSFPHGQRTTPATQGGKKNSHSSALFFCSAVIPPTKKAQDHHGWYISIMSPPKATGRSRKWHITVGRLVTRSGPSSSLLFSDFP